LRTRKRSWQKSLTGRLEPSVDEQRIKGEVIALHESSDAYGGTYGEILGDDGKVYTFSGRHFFRNFSTPELGAQVWFTVLKWSYATDIDRIDKHKPAPSMEIERVETGPPEYDGLVMRNVGFVRKDPVRWSVFVVESGAYEYRGIDGVYATLDDAKACHPDAVWVCKNSGVRKYWDDTSGIDRPDREDPRIEEWVLRAHE
jgi:hypothetical protein